MTSSVIHLYILHIFHTQMSLEVMQISANGNWIFYSFTEFYVIHGTALKAVTSRLLRAYRPYTFILLINP